MASSCALFLVLSVVPPSLPCVEASISRHRRRVCTTRSRTIHGVSTVVRGPRRPTREQVEYSEVEKGVRTPSTHEKRSVSASRKVQQNLVRKNVWAPIPRPSAVAGPGRSEAIPAGKGPPTSCGIEIARNPTMNAGFRIDAPDIEAAVICGGTASAPSAEDTRQTLCNFLSLLVIRAGETPAPSPRLRRGGTSPARAPGAACGS